jgi:D-inositol-3-phosphate glycosyltransferase
MALKAMACGTPVVASQVGGLAFLVQDNVTGFTVPVDEPDALADRISQLMSDPELRQRMGNQALIAAQDYDWEKISMRLISLYTEVIEQNVVETPIS